MVDVAFKSATALAVHLSEDSEFSPPGNSPLHFVIILTAVATPLPQAP